MIGVDPRNPFVALVREKNPGLDDDQVLIAALEAYDFHKEGIKELGMLAKSALGILGDGKSPTSLNNAVNGLMGGLSAGGVSSRANVFFANYPRFYEHIRSVTNPAALNATEVRKLLQDCIAMWKNGPAAE